MNRGNSSPSSARQKLSTAMSRAFCVLEYIHSSWLLSCLLALEHCGTDKFHSTEKEASHIDAQRKRYNIYEHYGPRRDWRILPLRWLIFVRCLNYVNRVIRREGEDRQNDRP